MTSDILYFVLNTEQLTSLPYICLCFRIFELRRNLFSSIALFSFGWMIGWCETRKDRKYDTTGKFSDVGLSCMKLFVDGHSTWSYRSGVVASILLVVWCHVTCRWLWADVTTSSDVRCLSIMKSSLRIRVRTSANTSRSPTAVDQVNERLGHTTIMIFFLIFFGANQSINQSRL